MPQDFTSSLFSNNKLDTEMCLSGFLRHRYLPHLNEKHITVSLFPHLQCILRFSKDASLKLE